MNVYIQSKSMSVLCESIDFGMIGFPGDENGETEFGTWDSFFFLEIFFFFFFLMLTKTKIGLEA